jgi:hypothetical protein
MTPIISFLMCYRVNHQLNSGNDIYTFFDSFTQHIPELDHSKFEFIIKIDSDDVIASLVLSDVQRKYKTLNIRFESYDRWSGRATLYLNYAYLFTQRSMSSRFIGFITGDCLITRNFLTEIETLLNDKQANYCIFSSQLDYNQLEHAGNYRVNHHWAGGGLTEPFPIVSVRVIEVVGGMGWQSNIDNWLSLLNVICYHKYGVMLYKRTPLPYIELNPVRQQMLIDEYYGRFNEEMYTSISQKPQNSYYFNLVEQQAQNIYLNMREEKIVK